MAQNTVQIFYQEDMSGGLSQLTSGYGFTTYVNTTTVGSDTHILFSSEVQSYYYGSSYSSNTFIHAFLLWDYDVTSNVMKTSYLPSAVFSSGTRIASVVANGKLYVLRDSTMNIYDVATASWSTPSSSYGLYSHLTTGTQVYFSPPSQPNTDVVPIYINNGYARRRSLLQTLENDLAGTIDMATGAANLVSLDLGMYRTSSYNIMPGSSSSSFSWHGGLLAGAVFMYTYNSTTFSSYYNVSAFAFVPSAAGGGT